MKVLVACEFSGVVRKAFSNLGHDAYSCDLLPADDGETVRHFQDDVLRRLTWTNWDLIIAHPPCTYLAVSGARWWSERREEQEQALDFVFRLRDAPCEKIAIENPIGLLSSRWRKPDQIIQPWQYGHGEVKATCLWLKGLPKLTPTNIVDGRYPRVHLESPGKDRWKRRSITYEGIANAMAAQWT